jgi:hypothetical protein
VSLIFPYPLEIASSKTIERKRDRKLQMEEARQWRSVGNNDKDEEEETNNGDRSLKTISMMRKSLTSSC